MILDLASLGVQSSTPEGRDVASGYARQDDGRWGLSDIRVA